MSAPATWILLRGLGREAGHWAPFVEAFGQRFSGAQVRTLDFPGVGRARKVSAPWSIDGIVDFLHDQIEGDAPTPWGILGHSLGGMVALAWAARHPDFIRHVVTI